MKKFYIVIEGSDGAGKETQSKLLLKNLQDQGIKAKMISFPNYESAGSGAVKMFLGGELCAKASDFNAYQASLPFAVDRLCTMNKLKMEEDDAEVIVFDRYVESNIIYQGSKIEDEKQRDEFINWELDLEFNKLGLPKPDVVIYLNVPFEISMRLARERAGLKNGQVKDIHESDEKYLSKTTDYGLIAAKKFGFNIIDCSDGNNLLSREEISKKITDLVMEKMSEETFNK